MPDGFTDYEKARQKRIIEREKQFREWLTRKAVEADTSLPIRAGCYGCDSVWSGPTTRASVAEHRKAYPAHEVWIIETA